MNIGNYRIEKLLGAGGMGTVHLAHDRWLDRPVAVKFPQRVDGDERKESQASLLREARSAARLQHPNIVSLYALEQNGSEFFLVMEYVDGNSVENLLREYGPMPQSHVLDLLRQCAEALDYAHGQGIVHRDVKPGNILLTAAGEAKLCDFGLADRDGAPAAAGGRVSGTPNYMAPEQVVGDPASARTDQYALAIVAFELLTGRRLFPHCSTEEMFGLILSSPPALDEIDARLRPALARALSANPEHRFASCQDLYRDLHARLTARPNAAPAAPSWADSLFGALRSAAALACAAFGR